MKCWLAARMSWTALLLLVGAGCAVPPPKTAPQALPPRPEEGRERKAWIESLHRAAPGVNWRQIEEENRQRSIARLAKAAGTASAPSGVWRQRGPINQTGRTWVTAVTGDGNTLLVGSGDEGGLFSGTPESGGWTERANPIGTGVKELVVVPGAPESWVGVAGDFYDVFVSVNQGVSWTRPNGLPPLPSCGFRNTRLLREPGASRTVYLLLTVPDCGTTPTYTLLRSDDGGLNFTILVSGNFSAAPDVWISRVAPGPLYLLTDAGLQSSANRGASFSLLSRIPGATGDTLRLAGSEAGAPSFYVLASDSNQNTAALFASADGGRTWVDRGTISDLTSDPYLANGVITASISTPSLVMLGGIDAYRSTDSGATFHPVSDWRDYGNDPAHLLHADVRGLDFFFYRGTETVFADTDGGTYMSTDRAVTFNNIMLSGIINGEYYSTLTSKNDPNLIAAGSQDQGLQQSTPTPLAAMSFTAFPCGDCGHLTSTAGDHNMLYAAGVGASGSVLVLDRESPPQNVTSTPSYPAGNRSWLPFILADPTDANAFYLTGNPLYRAHLDAAGWHWTAMPQDFSRGKGDYLTVLEISRANPSYWYAASSLGRLWYSHNQGATWTLSASSGPEERYLYGTTMLCSPSSATTCYVGGSGYSGPAVYKTTDGGVTWQEMGEGLPNTAVLGLAFDDPVQQNLYAAAEAGAFVFDPVAATWKSIVTEEAPLQAYWSVEGVPSLPGVRFGTYGKGIWDYLPAGGGGATDCTPGDSNLCLGGSRFKVEATWRTASGSGTASAVGLTPDTGYFWFFAPTNVEVVVKVLNGCGLNNRYWVFAGGLTNVEVVLKVTDTHTGLSKTYTNPLNQSFDPLQDTDALAVCP
jgi:photosystem II stability/assembly factor-like uncharacterized protein